MNLTLIQAVIFDMDGLMIDTERIAWETFGDACRAFSRIPDFEVYVQLIGTSYKETRELLTAGHGHDFPYDDIHSAWNTLYLRTIKEEPIPLKKGLLQLLTLFKERHYKIAVATSTRRETALIKLKNAGLFDTFPNIVAGDEVINSKPAPEIYLKAAAMTGTDPSNCLVLEDSDPGVRAALAAGMQVIQVPDLRKPSAEVLLFGHPILTSLEEVIDIFKGALHI